MKFIYDSIEEFLFKKVEEETEEVIKSLNNYGLIMDDIRRAKDRAFEEGNMLLVEFYDAVEQEVRLKARELNFE